MFRSGVFGWGEIGFEIMDLVGLGVDCMSMVASHGQCQWQRTPYIASWTEFGPKKKYRSIVCYACVIF